ncbi:MAG: hypothetical protein ACI808_000904 [Paraglaciecola sp.]|jgi:hypothetical protein
MVTLSNIMRVNAFSCIGFGITFFLFPGKVGSFLSSDMKIPEVILLFLGVGLFFNGIHLLWASFGSTPSKKVVLYFSIGDYIWVIGTSYLLLFGIWITTPMGIWVTILVSGLVGAFGILQMLKRNEMADCGSIIILNKHIPASVNIG